MPKLKPTEKEEANRVIRACISNNMELYRLDDEYVAAKIGISTRTFREKRDNPERFRFDEVRKLSKTLKLTPIQAASITMGRPLTNQDVREFIF